MTPSFLYLINLGLLFGIAGGMTRATVQSLEKKPTRTIPELRRAVAINLVRHGLLSGIAGVLLALLIAPSLSYNSPHFWQLAGLEFIMGYLGLPKMVSDFYRIFLKAAPKALSNAIID